MPRVKTLSFDLWDTIIVDDSDEPKRAAAGLPPKPRARRDLVAAALGLEDPGGRKQVDCAYDTTDAAARLAWYRYSVTWTVRERLEVVLRGLHRTLPADTLEELVARHERMELDVRPDLVPGVEDALKNLAETYPLVVVSDTLFSPGRALRELLESYGIARYFRGFVFSDEVGRAKPDPLTFQKAAELAGCRVEEIVHIGDREEKDIDGPMAVGARGILFTGVKDRGSTTTRAAAVCTRYADLAGIVASLDQDSP